MNPCRFMYDNLATRPDMFSVSSAQPGLAGMPAPQSHGSAVTYVSGDYIGELDQAFHVEIDSVSEGPQVGQATYRWRLAGGTNWEHTGVTTHDTLQDLADGVKIKWVSGPGDDFVRGDSWTVLATRPAGKAALTDLDRDTAWRTLGCRGENISVDLGSAQRVRAAIFAEHNLSPNATATLLANSLNDWTAPLYSQRLDITSPHLVLFLDQTYRYWRLHLTDPSNSDGELSLGMVFLGDYFQPSRTFAVDYASSTLAGRVTTATGAGKLAGATMSLASRWKLNFKSLDAVDAEGFQTMHRSIHDTERGRILPVFFTPFIHDPEGTYFCLPGAALDLSHRHQGRYSLSLSLEEIVKSHV